MEADSCRICLGDATEGRFISPCKCKGSIRFVHAHCLEKWRTSSPNPKSYWECDQCKYKYSYRRTFMARMLRNEIVVHLVTIACFFICSFFIGAFFDYFFVINKTHTFDTYSSYVMFHTVCGAMLSSIFGFCSLLCSLVFSVGFITGPTFPFSGGSYKGSDKANTIILIICMIIGLCYVFYHVYLIVSYLTEYFISKTEYLIENIS